ncbi:MULTISPECIES: CehA/McbA family metallohydrolase [Clostridium]|uniref:Polymerase/histidinol phosphatase N-terminal domain-containing protein n=2 Tax=Clostridium TaxID=1485 RepID=A0A151ALW5_9CLOT|nr:MULTISPECIES: CehA/McbA family metallohydrolase [Clostridium]KYH28520.1 hypothetical protein CLCOL_17810 [Clostridium colicanis DSM 13634]MBE6042812.1 hypothetical protein [Clostridium thermopalmarium]PRR69825.1 hypothetical protein CPAL_23780 [Clostridium thermopalmarium DSM 5974]PVZ21610.1 hypothetical protein LX19_02084 [Clostridium thermopalmarium DSM 5974]
MLNQLFIAVPENNATLTDRLPDIYLTILSNKYIDSLVDIKMYVDNKKVHHKVHKNKIIYVPKKKLKSGKHDIKVFIKDFRRQIQEIQWSFTITTSSSKSDKYNFYYGIPHAHTSFSTGKGTPLEAFKYAYKKSLDFLIITDHSGFLSKKVKYNSNEISRWNAVKISSLYFANINKKFLPLYGFEVSSRGLGDFNILNTINLYKNKIKNFKDFKAWLQKEKNPIVCINHPHKYIESLQYDDVLDKYINFIEVGNGSPPFKYLSGEKYYYKLLDKGWHLGAINGQDNHKENWGDTDNLTVVICKLLRYDEFFEALKSRRTYSTESRSLKLVFKANGKWMGSIIENNSNKMNLEIIAEDKKVPINKIQIISNGGIVVKKKSAHKKNKIKWNLSLPFKKGAWYVVKVIHVDGKVGISSPIFT